MYSSNFLKFLFGISITLLTILIFFLFFQYKKALDGAYENSQLTKKENVEDFAKNISKTLKNDFKIHLKNPFEIHPSVRRKADKLLSLFSGNQYAFVFVVAKDEQGKYRYIFDGSTNKEDKGEYLQKFDPASPQWDKALAEKSSK